MTFTAGPTPQVSLSTPQEQLDILWQKFVELQLEFEVLIGLQMQSYTVAGVPAPDTIGRLIYISDETGGSVPAFSDGTDWRRVTDRTVIA